MRFEKTPLAGAFVIDYEPIDDERGFFAVAWGRKAFAERGLASDFVQANVAWNRQRGTLRGMHFQHAPFAEAKLIRCTRGTIYDVIIDLRPASPSYTRWFGIELSSTVYRSLYVPEGFAHGYQTLSDDCEVSYQVSQDYAPQAASGVRYDDPAFAVVWPIAVTVISPKDLSWPPYRRG